MHAGPCPYLTFLILKMLERFSDWKIKTEKNKFNNYSTLTFINIFLHFTIVRPPRYWHSTATLKFDFPSKRHAEIMPNADKGFDVIELVIPD